MIRTNKSVIVIPSFNQMMFGKAPVLSRPFAPQYNMTVLPSVVRSSLGFSAKRGNTPWYDAKQWKKSELLYSIRLLLISRQVVWLSDIIFRRTCRSGSLSLYSIMPRYSLHRALIRATAQASAFLPIAGQCTAHFCADGNFGYKIQRAYFVFVSKD